MSDATRNATQGNDPAASAWRGPCGIGVVASIICIIGGIFDPVQFMRAYLPSWLFFLGLSLGSMVLVMIYHLVASAWGCLLRRILEAGMRTMPLVALLFIPIGLRIELLFPWARPDTVAANAQLQHETFYMNRPYFFARAAIFFILWLGMIFLLSGWSRAEDQGANERSRWWSHNLSGVGSVVYGVTLHFAMIDWAMAIMPAFHSTIWGPLFAVGQMLTALCMAVIAFSDRINHPPFAEVASIKAVNDMGSLMFTFLIACAYMAWFQFMLIWIANMPVDVIYYLPRSNTFWLTMLWLIVVFHFALPFFLLLWRKVKRNVALLAQVARLIVVMDIVYMYYQITPMFPMNRTATGGWVFGVTTNWMDFVMPLAMGGLWLAYFQWQISRRPLLVAGDQCLPLALHLRHMDEEGEARG